MPKVSVIMRTWNRAAYLPEAINSVIAQNFQDWELVVVSDGCTDSTPKLMAHYTAKDPRIKYFQKPHTGIGDTGNFGISQSTGEVIVQADSDDIQLPEKIDIALVGLEDADFTYSGFYYCNPKGDVWQYVSPKDFTIENIKKNEAAAGESIAFYRYVWEKTPYRSELSINDDAGFLVDLYKGGWRWSKVDLPSFKYRMMEDSTSYARKDEVDKLTLELYAELDGSTEGVRIK